MLKSVLVMVGGGMGSMVRYWMSFGIYFCLGRGFPYGTLAVNVLGSFLMGFLIIFIWDRFIQQSEMLHAFFLMGFLGGFTTFSSFSIETLLLFENGEILKAFINILLSVVLCLLSVWVGVLLGRQAL